MGQYVAAALAGIEAENEAEAFECAHYNVLDWEVTGVTPAEEIPVILGPSMKVVKLNDPRDQPLFRKGWFSERPMFGRASAVLGPLLAWVMLVPRSAPEQLVNSLLALSPLA